MLKSLFLSIRRKVTIVSVPRIPAAGFGAVAGIFSGNSVPVALCFALFFAVCVNIANALSLSPALALTPLPVAAAAVAGTRFMSGERTALMRCLAILCGVALFAVAAILVFPAWQLIASGGSSSWAGRMAPLFVSALALYAAALWLDGASSGVRRSAEQRLAGLFSGPGLFISFMAAAVVCAGCLLGLEWWSEIPGQNDTVTRRFLQRGLIPPFTLLFFFWGLLILLGKAWNILALRRVRLGDIPAAGGRDEFIKLLWQRLDESYLIPRYIVWAVPVLGFIGTVLGISLAADGIRLILSSDSGISGLSGELGGAIAPLGIAFDTTLIALSLSVVLMLALTLVQRSEEKTLADLERRLQDYARQR